MLEVGKVAAVDPVHSNVVRHPVQSSLLELSDDWTENIGLPELCQGFYPSQQTRHDQQDWD